MPETTLEEVAYAAGFFDGEGYVGVHKSVNKYSKYVQFYVRASVGQKALDALYWFQERFDGSIYNYAHKSCGEWVVTTAKARNFLEIIQPFLIVKKPQVDFILSTPTPLAQSDLDEMKRLKKVA